MTERTAVVAAALLDAGRLLDADRLLTARRSAPPRAGGTLGPGSCPGAHETSR
ncbi:hypothetical protein ACGFYV_25720 [Streptomyces sp. NPDC048297]|uniref:hypothetical protein n=1 Tax=Streptomyces sp. NPDC048297 TaxID=3365531 RepID=UPI00371BA43B